MYTKGSNALKTEYYTYDAPRKSAGKIKRMPVKKSSTKIKAQKKK